jgi:hypothetical protein
MKGVVIVVILVLGGIGWWLGSPLFLEGPSADEELGEGTVLSSGTLVRIDSTHWGEGTIELVQTADGYEVQFKDVSIANGPSLFVYLSEKSTFSGLNDDPGNYVDLGPLSANSGTFRKAFDTLPGFEVGSVLIWCDPFAVVFTYATLG